jgi:predicted nucleic acid-binding protein
LRPLVFDTGVLALLYADKERIQPAIGPIDDGRAEGLVSSVNLAEFFYKTCQRVGRDTAILWSRQLSERLRVVHTDLALSLAAGLEKCRNTKLSLADSFALALTRGVKGTLLTTDRELKNEKAVPVRYFEV